MATEVNDVNFDTEVINSDLPVLVDFWAPWCGPCRALAPVIDQLAEEYSGKAKIVKLNTDDNPNIAVQFRINSIPTMILFKDKKPVDMLVGALSKEKIQEAIDKLI
ncbi:MAG: thioredoxin [Candidatus Melainabacteria bacterium]|jgi:thioredoxin 1|nr:thioredoxin [Cyanobacteria bacterium REEB446]MEB3314802.1 thioredoxin [Candidatus Melainabacteria bacterium]NBV99755.1 thioredoxin [Pseudomonadota bacterium]